ncbi:MAG: hypothetical protein Kow0067_10560 [Coriobacteriia bacterium]
MYQITTPEATATVSAARVRRAPRERTRLTIVEASVLAIVAIALVAAAVGPALARDEHVGRTKTIKVSTNDSLWTIAAADPVDGLTTAQTVRLIKDMNGLSESVIVDGQLLTVPSDEHASAAMARR